MIEQKLKELSEKMKLHGVPLFYLRDPLKGKPSVSLSLLFISAHLVILSLFRSDLLNYEHSLNFFETCSFLYFGRSVVALMSSKSTQQKKVNEEET